MSRIERAMELTTINGQRFMLVKGKAGIWGSPFDGMRINFPDKEGAMPLIVQRIIELKEDIDIKKAYLSSGSLSDERQDEIKSYLRVVTATLRESMRLIGKSTALMH